MRLTLRNGSLLLHVNNESDLDRAIFYLKRQAPTSAVGFLADVASEVLAAGAAALPGRRIRSTRDVIYHGKKLRSPSSVRMLTQLNSACGLARPAPPDDLRAQVRRVAG